MPKTKLGKWSVGLQGFFLLAIIVSVILVKVVGVLDFGDRWWDVFVAIIFPASIIAFITGIIAKRRNKDDSLAVLLSILLGFVVIIFIIFHSLFIND